jgi:hypothetical protein
MGSTNVRLTIRSRSPPASIQDAFNLEAIPGWALSPLRGKQFRSAILTPPSSTTKRTPNPKTQKP